MKKRMKNISTYSKTEKDDGRDNVAYKKNQGDI